MNVITDNPIIYSNVDANVVAAGLGAVGSLGAGLANRQRRPLSAIEMKCGKKPLLGFTKKGKAWKDCSSKEMNNVAQQEQLATQPKKSKTILYVGIAVGVVALVGLVIYLKRR
tara:strand:+ start:1120 stop:1458 length:339 start_codon:yes stop_codon:yes gene_type:complete